MTEKFHLNMILDKELILKIDDYRFEMRFANRAEAVRFLLEFALKQWPTP